MIRPRTARTLLAIAAVLQPLPGHPVTPRPRTVPSILRDTAGRRVAVAALYRRGPAVLWFTNLCPNCQGGFTGLDSVVRHVGSRATITGVSFIRGDRDRVRAVVKTLRPSFRILLDEGGVVTRRFTRDRPVDACPLVNLVILDRHGSVVYRGHYPGTTPGELIRLLKKAVRRR